MDSEIVILLEAILSHLWVGFKGKQKNGMCTQKECFLSARKSQQSGKCTEMEAPVLLANVLDQKFQWKMLALEN